MRAIIIDDKDAINLLEQLQLKKYEVKDRIPDNATVEDVHRWFHYVVVNWLHDQGAKITR